MPLNIEKIRKLMGDKSEVMVAKDAGISRTTLRNILGGGKVEFTSLEKLATSLRSKTKDIIL